MASWWQAQRSCLPTPSRTAKRGSPILGQHPVSLASTRFCQPQAGQADSGDPQKALAEGREKACLPGQRVLPSSPRVCNCQASRACYPCSGPLPRCHWLPRARRRRSSGREQEGEDEGRREDGRGEREETAPRFVWHPCQSCSLIRGMSQGWNAPSKSLGILWDPQSTLTGRVGVWGGLNGERWAR